MCPHRARLPRPYNAPISEHAYDPTKVWKTPHDNQCLKLQLKIGVSRTEASMTGWRPVDVMLPGPFYIATDRTHPTHCVETTDILSGTTSASYGGTTCIRRRNIGGSDVSSSYSFFSVILQCWRWRQSLHSLRTISLSRCVRPVGRLAALNCTAAALMHCVIVSTLNYIN